MARRLTNDLDYLAARLHGRRSRMAEAERLDALCRLRNLPEFSRAVHAPAEFAAVAEFQRWLVQDLIRELSGFLEHLTGAGADLIAWLRVRFQVENMKVLVRGFVNRVPLESLREHLVTLPADLALDAPALATAESLDDFIRLLPAGKPGESLKNVAAGPRDQLQPFFLEAALDCGYLTELLARTARLSGEDRDEIGALVRQEVDIFHLMLAVRGKFHYGLAADLLLPLHVEGSEISVQQFRKILAAPDVAGAAGYFVGRVFEALPGTPKSSDKTPEAVSPAMLESLAWNQFFRLANRAFRRSHIGLGAVVGYAEIRRIEAANLITLSEGIRIGTPAEAIRKRLIPRTDLEAAHV